MKKTIISMALVLTFVGTGAMAFYEAPASPDVQTSASDVSYITGNLIGKSDIKVNRLVGEWSSVCGISAYSTPDALRKAGGEETTDTIGAAIDQMIAHFNAKDVTVTFSADGKVSAMVSGSTFEGSYTIEGSTMTITSGGRSFTLNVKQEGKHTLQLLYPFSQCPQQIAQAFSAYETEGLYLGIELKKH